MGRMARDVGDKISPAFTPPLSHSQLSHAVAGSTRSSLSSYSRLHSTHQRCLRGSPGGPSYPNPPWACVAAISKNAIISRIGDAEQSGGQTRQARGRNAGEELTRRTSDASGMVRVVLPTRIPTTTMAELCCCAAQCSLKTSAGWIMVVVAIAVSGSGGSFIVRVVGAAIVVIAPPAQESLRQVG